VSLSDNPDDIVCLQIETHQESCSRCSQSFAVIETLAGKCEAKIVEAKRRVRELCGLPEPPPSHLRIEQQSAPDWEELRSLQDASEWIEAINDGALSIEQLLPHMRAIGFKASKKKKASEAKKADTESLKNWLLAPWQLREVYFSGLKALRSFATAGGVEFDSNSKSAKQLKEKLVHFFEDVNRPEAAAEGGESDDAAADDGKVSSSVALIVALTIRTHA
jgi:hypothetical protein